MPIVGFKKMHYFLDNNKAIYFISILSFTKVKTVEFPQTVLIVK